MSVSSAQTAHGSSQNGHVGKGKGEGEKRSTGFVTYLMGVVVGGEVVVGGDVT